MEPKLLRQGADKLRPKARVMRTLGRDLISSEIVALVELVKNAYDADAKTVDIRFNGPLEEGAGSIVIKDDGTGMSLKTVRSAWYEPATSHKVRAKKSGGGRPLTGKKGIGRFAAARLASGMEMSTIAKGTKELVKVFFEWNAFDDEKRYLDQIKCKWKLFRAPRTAAAGTTLELKGLNGPWTLEDFRKLRDQLARLINPYAAERSDFRIILDLPDPFQDAGGLITPPSVLGHPHYLLKGKVDSKGLFKAQYKGRGDKKETSLEESILLEGEKPTCGSFGFEFRVWDRQADDLQPLADDLNKTVGALRKDLDSASGIGIYRDDFRVLMADMDWLRLDMRRVQNPTMRVSNNQIVGAVFITASGNPAIDDQSNREGIVGAPEFDDFKKVVLEILARLEARRDKYRRKAVVQEPLPGIFQELDFAPVKKFLLDKYPADKELKTFLQEKEQSFQHGVTGVQDVLSRYRRLATLGQLIDVVLHEGRGPLAAIKREAELLERDAERAEVNLDKLKGRAANFLAQADKLSAQFAKLDPLSGRKRGQPSKIEMGVFLKEAFAFFAKELEKMAIDVEIKGAEAHINAQYNDLQQIFYNLITNAIYWLGKKEGEKRRIVVKVDKDDQGIKVVFSDNGPGVPEDYRDKIFDPYFTGKPQGVGLGLTIAGETAMDYDGGLDLVSGGPLGGANFRVTLRKGT